MRIASRMPSRARAKASCSWAPSSARALNASSTTARSISDKHMSRKRVAVLISGRGSNMAALIEAAKAADYPAEIVLVVSNVPGAGGFATAATSGIATATIDHKTFGKDRAAFERALQDVLVQHRIDLVCLAGFKRILT